MPRYMIFIMILFIIFSTISNSYPQKADNGSTDTTDSFNTGNELIEWGIYTSLYLGAHFIDRYSPFFDESFLDGETDKPYKNETVPARWLGYWMFATCGFIALSPNNEGFFNSVTYSNIKGLYESFAYSYFATSATKAIFGKKRPSYDNYPESEKEHEGRQSFVSGHSSTSFTLASYGSLYIIEHSGRNRGILNITLKATAVTALTSAATYVAWTRVNDNRHSPADVIGGAAVGIASGFAGYMHQNGWFRRLFSEKNISIAPYATAEESGLAFVRSF